MIISTKRKFKKNQTQILDLKSTITKLKNSLKKFNSRVGQAEERISKLEDRATEIFKSVEQKETRLKKGEQSLRDLWDTTKWTNIICIMGIPEGEEREGAERIVEETMAENFPNLMKDMSINIQDGQ